MINREEVSERMSRIVEHNGVVYLAGIVSDDKTLDIKGQAARALEIAEQRLNQIGSNKDSVLRVEIFLKDIYRDFQDFNSVWDEWVSKENPPARACVEANMASTTTLVELVVTAVKS
ncbi:RidA family protein [Arcobacter roscoffensis]|uniref:RidA family protein n=1 Tax=Arcobacter roscoffensis TaxID=2961520 RepID=A0ABY5E7C3_9BACT|nr:RidA family protein [Arcobacter roscoffensis]UTJ07650.1 RidA family protein [Arcobacter roscoffensis]